MQPPELSCWDPKFVSEAKHKWQHSHALLGISLFINSLLRLCLVDKAAYFSIFVDIFLGLSSKEFLSTLITYFNCALSVLKHILFMMVTGIIK